MWCCLKRILTNDNIVTRERREGTLDTRPGTPSYPPSLQSYQNYPCLSSLIGVSVLPAYFQTSSISLEKHLETNYDRILSRYWSSNIYIYNTVYLRLNEQTAQYFQMCLNTDHIVSLQLFPIFSPQISILISNILMKNLHCLVSGLKSPVTVIFSTYKYRIYLQDLLLLLPDHLDSHYLPWAPPCLKVNQFFNSVLLLTWPEKKRIGKFPINWEFHSILHTMEKFFVFLC